MYYTIEQHQEDFYYSKILDFYFEDLNIGVIDIETTGLNPVRNRFILGGLLVPDSTGKCTMQFLAESNEEEITLLHTYLSHLKNLDVLISYNGEQFDMPFLIKRLKNYDINIDDLFFCYSFDSSSSVHGNKYDDFCQIHQTNCYLHDVHHQRKQILSCHQMVQGMPFEVQNLVLRECS